ncbi:unnamed protein product, partial [Arabidopsis halleri]
MSLFHTISHHLSPLYMFRIALHACCTFLWFSGDLELLMSSQSSSQSSTLSSHRLKTLDHVISSPNGVHGRVPTSSTTRLITRPHPLITTWITRSSI